MAQQWSLRQHDEGLSGRSSVPLSAQRERSSPNRMTGVNCADHVRAESRMPYLNDAPSSTLAAYLAAARWEDMPAVVRHEAKRALLNFIGCALGGCRESPVDKAVAALRVFRGPEQATVLGRSERFDALNAAFFNAISGNVFDFDDTHLRTVIHPSAPVAPVLLAWSERSLMSGPCLLHAFALGVEVACRIGNAVSPWHYNHGWHITSTCGVFGAAMALGKILGLDARQLTWALGHAAVQSAGLVEGLGVDAKSLSVGNAARNGMVAALLAEQDFTGPAQPLEGHFGFLRVLGESAQLNAMADRLGETWELLHNTYKPYPCGVVLHPVIDACLALRARHHIDASKISRITVHGNPLLRLRTDRAVPTSGRLAQVSLQHSVGVAFVEGQAGLAQYSDESVRNVQVLLIGERLHILDDPMLATHAAKVTVKLQDGSEHQVEVEHALGSHECPLNDSQLETKFRQLAKHGNSGVDVERLIGSVWDLENVADVGSIVHGLAASR